MVIAVPVLAVEGRGQWFFQDEWVYLSARDGGSLDGLLEPHNEHWSTIPVVAYRLLWNVVGLRSYLPYQAMIILVHLAVVGLLRAQMRRAGVGPWISSAAAIAFLFYGTGYENLVWGFQVAFTTSVALGLAALLLSDEPRPSPRRRLAAIACGVGALMSSGVGPIMIGVVALALLMRRGWRAATTFGVPLAAVYVLWWAAYGRDAGSGPVPSPGELLDFMATGFRAALVGLGQSRVAAVLLVLVTLLGVGVAGWTTARHRPDRGMLAELGRTLGSPVAMAVGAVVFFAVTGVSRAVPLGTDFAARSRYSYVAVVLLLPLIAVAIDAVARRWPLALVPGLLLLVVGIPGNVEAIDVRRGAETPQELVLALAHSDVTADVDRSARPFPDVTGARALTAGWLHDGATSGRIPEPDEPSAELEAEIAARLALRVVPRRTALGGCVPLHGEQIVELDPGDAVGFRGALVVQVEGPDGALSKGVLLGSFEHRALTTAGPPLTLHIRPRPRAYPELCL
jgi:hypothetical protein